MTAPDHATNHSKNTLRERGHPYMLLTVNMAVSGGIVIATTSGVLTRGETPEFFD